MELQDLFKSTLAFGWYKKAHDLYLPTLYHAILLEQVWCS